MESFARNFDVGEQLRQEGYRHTTANLFAPKWTVPGRSSVSITEFDNPLTGADMFFPEKREGLLISRV